MKEEQKSGATAFSRSKTIKQQREFLPIYASRAELLKIIRENRTLVSLNISWNPLIEKLVPTEQ